MVQSLSELDLRCEEADVSNEARTLALSDFVMAISFIKGHRILTPKYIKSLLAGPMMREREFRTSIALKNNDVSVVFFGERSMVDKKDFGIYHIRKAFADESNRVGELERALARVYKFSEDNNEIENALYKDTEKMFLRVCRSRDSIWASIDKASGTNLSRFRFVLKDQGVPKN